MLTDIDPHESVPLSDPLEALESPLLSPSVEASVSPTLVCESVISLETPEDDSEADVVPSPAPSDRQATRVARSSTPWLDGLRFMASPR
jgi:hypothetical protein